MRGRRGFVVGMAAGEAGRRRYSHKGLTQELTQRCSVNVDIKSFESKGDHWRGVKRTIWSPKEFFMTESKPAFCLAV